MISTLIVGYGYVGAVLADRLAARGHAVSAVRRGAEDPGVATLILTDVTDRDAIRRSFPAHIDNVVYLVSPDARTPDGYAAAYVHGIRNVVDELRLRSKTTLRRFVFISSTRVYGQNDGSWVDESSPVSTTDFAGRALLMGEQSVRAAPCPSAVVRFTGIYGPGRTRTIDRVKQGDAECIEGARDYTNRIHRDDAAGLVAHLITSDGAMPEMLIGSDSEPAPRCDVYRWIARRLSLPMPPTVAGPPRDGKRCSNRGLLRTGYRLAYPTYREGYRPLLDAAVSA